MKRIAFVLDSFNIGGIPKAAIPFLEQLKNHYEVTLFLSNDGGDLYSQIPNGIKKVFVKEQSVKKIFINRLKSGKIFSTLFLFLKWLFLGKRIVKKAELLAPLKGLVVDTEFDAVFCYHGMNLWNLMTGLYRIRAKKKTAWVHGEHPYVGQDKKDIEKVYNKFDRIYLGSEVCMNNYISYFPSLKHKFQVYYNLIKQKEILERTSIDNDLGFNKTVVNIVTVGRLSPEKGQDMIPKAVEIILNEGFDIRWYLVGDGADLERIKSLAKEFDVEKNIVFTGNKLNPFPYVTHCDIYVQPSYNECYSIAIAEAAILGKATVITKCCGIKEDLEDRVSTMLTEINSESIASAIIELLKDKSLKGLLENNVKKIDFSHEGEIKKLLEYI